MSELKIFALKCPSCGGALKFGADIEDFACGYCGASVRVERGGGTVSLQVITESIAGIQRGTDRTAAELAIRRITDDVRQKEREKAEIIDAKGAAAAIWNLRLAAALNQSSGWALFIVLVVVVVASASLIPEPYGMPVGLVLAVVACVFVQRTIDRGIRRQIARVTESRDAEQAQFDARLTALQANIDSESGKLSKHRELVDG